MANIFDTLTKTGMKVVDPGGLFKTPDPAKIPAYQEDFAKAQAAQAAAHAAAADRAAAAYQLDNPLNGALMAAVDPYNNQAVNGPDGLIVNARQFASGDKGRAITADARGNLADAAAAGRAIGSSDTGSAAAQGVDAGALRAASLGQGPSAAEALAQDQLQRNVASQAALAATARGGNVAAAMRTAANSGTNMALQSQAQVAALRAQEQATARGQLAQVDQATRAADQSRAVAGAGAAGQVAGVGANLAGTQAGLATAGLSGLNASGQLFQEGTKTQVQAATQQSAAEQAYLDYLQRMYATAAGIPTSQVGTLGSLALGNQQAQQTSQGAKTSAIGGLIGAII